MSTSQVFTRNPFFLELEYIFFMTRPVSCNVKVLDNLPKNVLFVSSGGLGMLPWLYAFAVAVTEQLKVKHYSTRNY